MQFTYSEKTEIKKNATRLDVHLKLPVKKERILSLLDKFNQQQLTESSIKMEFPKKQNLKVTRFVIITRTPAIVLSYLCEKGIISDTTYQNYLSQETRKKEVKKQLRAHLKRIHELYEEDLKEHNESFIKLTGKPAPPSPGEPKLEKCIADLKKHLHTQSSETQIDEESEQESFSNTPSLVPTGC